jgi:hypothetical protein
MSDVKTFSCTADGCPKSVSYDPGDSRHRVIGAALRRVALPKEPLVVYLTCPLGHTRRYEISYG